MLTFVHFRKGKKSKGEPNIRAFKKANTLASLNYYICLLLKLYTHDRPVSPLLDDIFISGPGWGEGTACLGTLMEKKRWPGKPPMSFQLAVYWLKQVMAKPKVSGVEKYNLPTTRDREYFNNNNSAYTLRRCDVIEMIKLVPYDHWQFKTILHPLEWALSNLISLL